MKRILFLLLLPIFAAAQHTYYVSPTGIDSNPGTILQPWLTWDNCNGKLSAGDIVYIRDGIYYTTKGAGAGAHCYWQNLSNVTIQNYPGEHPILDCSNIGTPTALNPALVYVINCNGVHFKGLHVRNLAQICCDQGISRGWDLDTSPNCIIEFCEVDHIGGGGFHLINSNDVTYINCDSHHNADPNSGGSAGAYGGSDGFSCTGQDPSTRTHYIGCRAWLNSDDGWDNFRTNGIRTWDSCWSFWNGYRETSPYVRVVAGDGDGFKLGPLPVGGSDVNTTLRYLNNCFSFENGLHGFENNGAPTCQYTLYNCTAYSCLGNGFEFGYQTTYPGPTDVFKNNLAYACGTYKLRYCGSDASNTNNTWNNTLLGGVCGRNGGPTVTNADFQSVSDVGVDGARAADGTLPNLTFMHLASGSGLRGAGTNVGYGTDIGAFQFSGSTLPTANAGLDQIITLPVTSTTVTGVGTGSSLSYQWSALDGGTLSAPTSATTNITGLTTAIVYRFVFRVTDGSSNVARDTMTVTVNSNNTIVPTGVIVKGVTLNDVILKWGATPTSNSIGFNIFRKVNTGSYSQILNVPVNGTDYSVPVPCLVGTNYYYICPVDKQGVPACSAAVSVKKK